MYAALFPLVVDNPGHLIFSMVRGKVAFHVKGEKRS